MEKGWLESCQSKAGPRTRKGGTSFRSGRKAQKLLRARSNVTHSASSLGWRRNTSASSLGWPEYIVCRCHSQLDGLWFLFPAPLPSCCPLKGLVKSVQVSRVPLNTSRRVTSESPQAFTYCISGGTTSEATPGVEFCKPLPELWSSGSSLLDGPNYAPV